VISESARDAVRIVELPACTMVWSGVCPGSASTSTNERLRRFGEYWPALDEARRDRFYARDFMWYDDAAGGTAWGLAVADVPADTGGFDVIDFPGGLYAVATYSEGDAEGAYGKIKEWVEASGCFLPDESRHHLWQSFGRCSEPVSAVMGYAQYDFYFPILTKERAQ